MAETIQIMCPSLRCRKILAVPVTARGKTVRCKSCQASIRIPSGSGATQVTPADQKRPA